MRDRVSGQLGQVHVVAVTQRNHLRAHRSRRPRPGGEPDHRRNDDRTAAFLSDAERDQDQQHKRGDDEEQVGEERDNIVHRPAYVARRQAQDQADQGGNQAGNQADHNRHTGGGDQLGQHIPAEVVGAKRQYPHVGYLADIRVIRQLDGARLRQGARVCLFGRDDGPLGRQEAGKRVVEPDEVVAPRVGHPRDVLLRIVVALPLLQEPCGVGSVNLTLGDSGQYEPLLHGLAVILAQPAGHALGGRFFEEKRVLCGGVDAVIGAYIDARREKGALGDDFQRRIGDDQGVNEHE